MSASEGMMRDGIRHWRLTFNTEVVIVPEVALKEDPNGEGELGDPRIIELRQGEEGVLLVTDREARSGLGLQGCSCGLAFHEECLFTEDLFRLV